MRSQAQYLPPLLLILAIFLRSSYSLLGSCGVRRCGTGRYINTRLNRGNTLYSSRSSQKAPKEIEERWDLDDSAEAEREEQADEDEILGIQDDVDFKSGFVSILGNPNVGKSTLLNAFLGETLCIVSPKPQTTRHRILGVLTEEKYQLVFSDTPGMMEPVYKLQEAMMDSVRGAVGDADVIVLVSDVYGEPLADVKIMQKLAVTSRPIMVVLNKVDLLRGDYATGLTRSADGSSEAESESENVQSSSEQNEDINSVTSKDVKVSFKKKLLQRKRDAIAKESESLSDSISENIKSPSEDTDRQMGSFFGNTDYSEYKDEYNEREGENSMNWKGTVRSESSEKTLKAKSMVELEAIWKQRLPRSEIIAISAKNKVGIQELLDRIVGHMAQGPKYFTKDTLTNRDERFFTGEIIRESVFSLYKDEIPYSCEVVIDSFKDKTPQLSVIEACIVISKDSQKAILIGKGGMKLKELGTMAREKLEKFLDRKVFLSLHVRVDEDWRASTESLTRYGYVESDFG